MACDLFLPGCQVTLHTFALPDGRLPAHWGEVKQRLEDLAIGVEQNPDFGAEPARRAPRPPPALRASANGVASASRARIRDSQV